MQDMDKKRIAWLDYTKAFGICMVMLIHVVQYFPPLSLLDGYIRSFVVPIFFVAAGYLAGVKQESAINIGKRCKEMLIPYIAFSIINSAIKFGVLWLKGEITKEIIKRELTELTITGNGTVYFLLSLFLVELLFMLSKKIEMNENVKLVFSIVFMFGIYLLEPANSPFLVVLYRVIVGLGYYSVGYLFYKLRCKYSLPDESWMFLVIIGSGIELAFGCATEFFEGKFMYPVNSILSAVATSLGWMLFFEKISKKDMPILIHKFLNYYGINSLIIMLVHPILLQFVMYPFGAELGKIHGIGTIIAATVIYVVLVVAEIPFVWIIKNYFFFLLGKGRNVNKEKESNRNESSI